MFPHKLLPLCYPLPPANTEASPDLTTPPGDPTMKFTLSCECDCADELAALIAKLNGKCAKPAPADDEPADDEKPAKKKVEPADDADAEEKPKVNKTDKLKNTIREKLRELSEKTDRKTAVKLLNKYGESVDAVDADELETLLEKVEAAIEAA